MFKKRGFGPDYWFWALLTFLFFLIVVLGVWVRTIDLRLDYIERWLKIFAPTSP